MATHGYKKYMKQSVRKGHPLITLFVLSFFGMLLLCTFLINSFAKNMSVDTSIGDYKDSQLDEIENKDIVDNRLAIIQEEDKNKTFTELMKNPDDENKNKKNNEDFSAENNTNTSNDNNDTSIVVAPDTVYKVYIGYYTSAEQAKVAKEIIQESGNGLNPIVKCIGANNYTLQVGIFKNKQSAETMLVTIQKSNLPGRIIQEN